MNPIDDAWATITSFRNLQRATKRAAKGKGATAGVARFLFRMEPELLRLQRELQDGTWRPGVPFEFEIEDPKPRTIAAAPFRDRVVHHALIDPIEDALDACLVDQTFACRRQKGQHRALRYAQRLVRKSEWFLKLDVKSFFPSLAHEVVMATLGAVIGDARALGLCERIVRAGGVDGRSLPIGNLTSQWFANLVLGRLDHHVLTVLRPVGYVRYMDDFVLFGDDKATLQAMHGEVAVFLAHDMQLRLKAAATILQPVTQGLPFLGFRAYRGMLRLRPQNLRRTRERLRQRRRQFAAGVVNEQQYADSVRAVIAHLRHGDTLRLRRMLFAGDTARAAAGHFLRRRSPDLPPTTGSPSSSRTCRSSSTTWPSSTKQRSARATSPRSAPCASCACASCAGSPRTKHWLGSTAGPTCCARSIVTRGSRTAPLPCARSVRML